MLENLYMIGQTLAGFGIILSLVYAAQQVRQASEIAQIEASFGNLSGQIDFHMKLAANPQIADLWARGTSGEAVQPNELPQFQQLLHACFTGFESQFYLDSAGAYSSELYDRSTSQIGYLLNSKAVAEWWQHSRMHFSESFKASIDGLSATQSGLGSLGVDDRI
jgi:hypothetical protein